MIEREPREDWWNEDPTRIPERWASRPGPTRDPWDSEETHGASGVGNVRKTQVSTGRILAIIAVVLLVLAALLLVINDLRSGTTGGDRNPTVTTGLGLVDPTLTSPDTVARRLDKAGYQVMPLVTGYDKHAYDVADTEIGHSKAQILVFSDSRMAQKFLREVDKGHVIVYDKLWAIDFYPRPSYDVGAFAREIAGKLGAQVQGA